MKRPRIQLAEGDLFCVPVLDNTALVLGLLARYRARTYHGLVYFFAPPFANAPDPETLDVGSLSVLAVCQSSIACVRDGSWRNIGPLAGFSRKDWPLPAFWYGPPLEQPEVAWNPKVYVKRTYNDWDGKLYTTEERVDEAEARTLPRDGLYGSGAVVVHLDILLKEAGFRPMR
jgi:hypothetical protein